MQKTTSIIFLLLFSAMQYGKLISYWNCKITNSSDMISGHCECEKILTTDGYGNADFHATVQVIKTEDWMEKIIFVPITRHSYPIIQSYFILKPSPPSSGFAGSIFQPPRIHNLS